MGRAIFYFHEEQEQTPEQNPEQAQEQIKEQNPEQQIKEQIQEQACEPGVFYLRDRAAKKESIIKKIKLLFNNNKNVIKSQITK